MHFSRDVGSGSMLSVDQCLVLVYLLDARIFNVSAGIQNAVRSHDKGKSQKTMCMPVREHGFQGCLNTSALLLKVIRAVVQFMIRDHTVALQRLENVWYVVVQKKSMAAAQRRQK